MYLNAHVAFKSLEVKHWLFVQCVGGSLQTFLFSQKFLTNWTRLFANFIFWGLSEIPAYVFSLLNKENILVKYLKHSPTLLGVFTWCIIIYTLICKWSNVIRYLDNRWALITIRVSVIKSFLKSSLCKLLSFSSAIPKAYKRDIIVWPTCWLNIKLSDFRSTQITQLCSKNVGFCISKDIVSHSSSTLVECAIGQKFS